MDKFNEFFVNLADKLPFGKDFFKSNLPIFGIEINNLFLVLISLILVIVAVVLVIALVVSNKKDKKVNVKAQKPSEQKTVEESLPTSDTLGKLVDKQPARENKLQTDTIKADVSSIEPNGSNKDTFDDFKTVNEVSQASETAEQVNAETEESKFGDFEAVTAAAEADETIENSETGLEADFLDAKLLKKEEVALSEPEINEKSFFEASDEVIQENADSTGNDDFTKLVAAAVAEAPKTKKVKVIKVSQTKTENAEAPAVQPIQAPDIEESLTVDALVEQFESAVQESAKSKTVNSEEPKEEQIKKKASATTVKKNVDKKYSGKFEINLTVSGYRFFLIASNGQLLYESNGYTSLDGAQKGIETFKNAVPNGVFVVDEDKFGRFRFILNKRYAGENYTTKAACEGSIDSVKKFSQTAVLMPYIIDAAAEKAYAESMKARKNLKEIDWTEIEKAEAEVKPSGKFEVVKASDGFHFDLLANNGQLLYASNGYASYKSIVEGIKNFKKTVYTGTFLVDEDKFGRFRYILRGATFNSTYIGESYTTRQACEKIIQSVKKFVKSAVMPE